MGDFCSLVFDILVQYEGKKRGELCPSCLEKVTDGLIYYDL